MIDLNKVRTFLVLNWLLSHNSKTLYIFRFNTGKSKLCDIQVAQGHGLTPSPCHPVASRGSELCRGQDLKPLELFFISRMINCGTIIMIQLSSKNNTKNRILLHLIIIQKYAHFQF